MKLSDRLTIYIITRSDTHTYVFMYLNSNLFLLNHVVGYSTSHNKNLRLQVAQNGTPFQLSIHTLQVLQLYTTATTHTTHTTATMGTTHTTATIATTHTAGTTVYVGIYRSGLE